MNRKFVTLAFLALASFGTQAGVKVTALDLNTNGANGYVSINLEGRSQELPDIKVYGKTIEIVLSNAEAFNAITKNVRGAQLSANVLNGKAIVKAILPYDIAASGVDLGWKNSNIEVVFPRGKVTNEVVAATIVTPAKTTTAPAAPVAAKVTPVAVENKVLAKVEKQQVNKEALNEDYLNNLVKEETARKETDTPRPEAPQDELKVKQSAIAKTEAVNDAASSGIAKKTDNFSFAGYAVKFSVFLALVLGLFYGVVQLLKKGVFNRGKLGFLNNSQLIQVMSTTYVAPKRSLMVVKAHKQIFLVANSESGLQFLAEMTDTTGLIKEGEKQVTGSNFDLNLGSAEASVFNDDFGLKLKENINESTPVTEKKSLSELTAKDIVKFSDELKKKAKKLKPIEFN